MIDSLRKRFKTPSLKKDAVAGLVLGVESIPDGLAQGLVAGVNPIYGLYGYLYGMVGAAFVTSSIYMTVQATGAMSLVVADVSIVQNGEDADRALFTLAIMTGVVMIAAGLLKGGVILRFVSNAVMVGFMTAVGINIILGQLDNFTGYEAEGAGRLGKTFDLLLHPFQMDLRTVIVGVTTILLMLLLERTRLGALGMVVAVIAGSAMVVLFSWDVQQLRDVTAIPSGLPLPAVPLLSAIPELIIPAVSLAFVGLVQGAGITASYPNPDGEYGEPSRDFIGQGIGNVVSGIFRGMPVGGSASATGLVKEAGMASSVAQLTAGLVMAITIIFFATGVSYIAMPALAALLMVVGFRTIKPADIVAVWKTGRIQQVVMASTLILTILIPLQYAVLVGVALSMIMHIINTSSNVVVKRLVLADGEAHEVDVPDVVPAREVVALQLYGSIFFASAATFASLLPDVEPSSRGSAVILRLRGKTDLGSTFTDLLGRYAQELEDVDSQLFIMSVEPVVLDQLVVAGVVDTVGSDYIYPADDWLGREFKSTINDAQQWVDAHAQDGA
ncbi:MAG: SulP family inorganic anion transporter [Acidimicrobiia bacterium]